MLGHHPVMIAHNCHSWPLAFDYKIRAARFIDSLIRNCSCFIGLYLIREGSHLVSCWIIVVDCWMVAVRLDLS